MGWPGRRVTTTCAAAGLGFWLPANPVLGRPAARCLLAESAVLPALLGEPHLLVEVGLDHVADDGGRQIAVLAVLEQRHHHDLRALSRGAKPTNQALSFIFLPSAVPLVSRSSQLRGARLAADLEMRQSARTPVPPSLTTPYMPSITFYTLSGFSSSRRFPGSSFSFTRCGWYQMPPIAMPPMARASCSGVTVSAPWPIATEMVSPAYHFWR